MLKSSIWGCPVSPKFPDYFWREGILYRESTRARLVVLTFHLHLVRKWLGGCRFHEYRCSEVGIWALYSLNCGSVGDSAFARRFHQQLPFPPLSPSYICDVFRCYHVNPRISGQKRSITDLWWRNQGEKTRRVQDMANDSQISKHGRTTNDMDRVSSFPDSILGHILSFLPAKSAVATSILSTRWKSVFLQVHDIKLDDAFLQNSQTKSAKSCVCSKSQTTYIDYANRLLMLASGMRTFRLKSSNLDERSVANLWIRSSLTRNIQELDIKVDRGCVPVEIFTCNSLVVLQVEGDAELDVPKFVSLPKLKVMKLKLLTVGDGDEYWEFGVGYPLLEDLQLHDIEIYVGAIRISISTLQKLSVYVDVGGGGDFEKGIVLNTPNLCYLELQSLHLLLEPSSKDYYNSQPLFGKLKFLELRDVYGYGRFDEILHNAPNLETLVCNVWLRFYEEDKDDDVEYENHLLREVEIRNFGDSEFGSGFDLGLKMVLYFLKFGVLLKKMTIVDAPGYDFKEVFKSATFRKFLLQASYSPAVQLLHRSCTLTYNTHVLC